MTFRSQQMGHYQLIISRQNAYNVINQIAKYDLAHFVDNGDILNRQFYPQVKRCEQSLTKIDAMVQKLESIKVQFQQYDETQKEFMQKLYLTWEQQQNRLGIVPIMLFDKVQQEIHTQYQRFRDLDQRLQKIKANRKENLQQIACYETIQSFFGESIYKRESQQYYINNVSGSQNNSGVSYMVGVIQPNELIRLSKMIYRVSRGYACIKEMDAFTFQPLKTMQQRIILIIYPTSKSSVLQKKIQRVVQSFCHNYFIFSKMQVNPRQMIERLRKQYTQVEDMIFLIQKEIKSFLTSIRDVKHIQTWRLFLWKERLIYQTLNKFEIREQVVSGEIYVPLNRIQPLSLNLSHISPCPTLHPLALGSAPTSFATNSFTIIAQQITNTYGVPRYLQINPSIMTCVTFPFFFGVMFGDIAHGCVLFLFGLYLVFCNDKVKKSVLKVFSQLRYMILMMGFFAFYCGWIYNDFMGMNINFFGSCYKVQPMPDQEDQNVEPTELKPEGQCIYPFGIDPVWGRSKNNLQFVNSLKMKISVIIAIIHMTVGVIIKAYNSRFFKKTLDFYYQFIPQFIFLFLLFGYMDFLVVFKWLQNWDDRKQWAPSIISTMMNIGLKMGQTSKIPDGGSNMWGQTGNTSQDSIQLYLLLIALICVPWMLLPKPIIQIKKANLKKLHNNSQLRQSEQEFGSQISMQRKLMPSVAQDQQAHGQHDSNEIFVHQLIETIEYVLGAISNTASYLRLWALSLAHSQLALVFFQKTLQTPFSSEGSFAILSPMMIITFYALIWVTFGILMCMDSMECFLHSLRLHWVEFQNKFYKGDGYKYDPLSFKTYILSQKKSAQN